METMQKYQYIFLLILSALLNCRPAAISKKGCSILFPKKDDRLQPIILTNITKWSYDFSIPDGQNLNIDSKNTLTFLCAPKGNMIERENINMVSYPCYGEEKFLQKQKIIFFDDIRCKSIVKGSTITTHVRCGNNMGKIINIGYQVTSKQFLTLIQSCYDIKSVNPIYTSHTLFGKAFSAFSTQSYRPSFSREAIPHNLNVNDLYKQKIVKEKFVALLKDNSVIEKYFGRSQFLARGHLSPDADFVYAPMQFATYFFINVNPQWQSINAGNWLKIESMVRKLAGRLKVSLQIYTGFHDILTLPDVNNNSVEIYLDFDNRIPVPKYLWKIVYNEKTKEGIALIAINNPFLDFVSEEYILCPDICDEYYWGNPAFKTTKKGYVYCCHILALKRVVHTIPYLQVTGVLAA